MPMEASRLKVLKGEDAISVYTFGEGGIEHCFCTRCGIRTFGRSTRQSAMHPNVAINVATLDLLPEDFMKFDITYIDGWHDRQDSPDITGYL